nr:hypothetical protein CFP56_01240 [Quercus suber]
MKGGSCGASGKDDDEPREDPVCKYSGASVAVARGGLHVDLIFALGRKRGGNDYTTRDARDARECRTE